jgi:flagellar hook-length control protein FliK
MTINASTACGGAATLLSPPDPSDVGAVASAEASPFSETLLGMAAEMPGAGAVAQSWVGLDEVEDPAVLDPASLPADVAAQALVAALMPGIAVPVLVPQLRQTANPSANSPSAAAAGTARLAEVLAPASDSLAAAWLAGATTGVASDAAPQDALVDGETLQRLATPGPAASGTVSGIRLLPQVQSNDAGVAAGSAFRTDRDNALQPQPPLQHSVAPRAGLRSWARGSRLWRARGGLSGSDALPEHLGPLHVQIDIKDDVASVWFGSQHADTRAALNDALPRLREMFGTAGLVLGDTGVSRDTPRQEARAAESRRFAAQREDAVSGSTERRGVRIAHAGILDTYA